MAGSLALQSAKIPLWKIDLIPRAFMLTERQGGGEDFSEGDVRMTDTIAANDGSAPVAPTEVVKAKLLVREPGSPVQLTLSARDAECLVSIAEDFSRSASAAEVEGDPLVDAAAIISGLLRDCLLAREGLKAA